MLDTCVVGTPCIVSGDTHTSQLHRLHTGSVCRVLCISYTSRKLPEMGRKMHCEKYTREKVFNIIIREMKPWMSYTRGENG